MVQEKYADAIAAGLPLEALEREWFEIFEEPMVRGSYRAFLEFGCLDGLVDNAEGRRDDPGLYTLHDDRRASPGPRSPPPPDSPPEVLLHAGLHDAPAPA